MTKPEEVVGDDENCFDAISIGNSFRCVVICWRQRGCDPVPQESIKTGSLSLTMGKCRRFPR